ncbi:MAG: dynamin family protein [Acidimicrobiales bacterium]
MRKGRRAQRARRAEELATEADGRPEADRAARLCQRLSSGQLLVAVVGESKRGKSTPVNALLGAEVVPSGVLPLTTVATEICSGEPRRSQNERPTSRSLRSAS